MTSDGDRDVSSGVPSSNVSGLISDTMRPSAPRLSRLLRSKLVLVEIGKNLEQNQGRSHDNPWCAAMQQHWRSHESSRLASVSGVFMKKNMGLVISPWHAEWGTTCDNHTMGSLVAYSYGTVCMYAPYIRPWMPWHRHWRVSTERVSTASFMD